MTSATASATLSRTPLRRDWRRGLPSLLRFVTTPSDLGNSFEAMFALAGPTVQRQFDDFAAHPVGRALLAERPRRDLNATLCDTAALAAMPGDSLAAAYLRYLGGEDMGSAAYFLEAADLDDKARRFGWSDDQLWFIRRMANSHDLFHLISGYDRDVVGEVGVIAYTAGQVPLLPLRLLLPFFASLRPAALPAWWRFLRGAYLHGRDTPPLMCVDYEAMLALPIDEVRERIGGPTLQQSHPNGLPQKGWLLAELERRVELV